MILLTWNTTSYQLTTEISGYHVVDFGHIRKLDWRIRTSDLIFEYK